jgi:hypothetical protein
LERCSIHPNLNPSGKRLPKSLAYSRCKEAIPPLISVLAEPDVRMRFWAVFAVGSIAYSRAKRGGGSQSRRRGFGAHAFG